MTLSHEVAPSPTTTSTQPDWRNRATWRINTHAECPTCEAAGEILVTRTPGGRWNPYLGGYEPDERFESCRVCSGFGDLRIEIDPLTVLPKSDSRLRVFTSVGLFETTMTYDEDTDFWTCDWLDGDGYETILTAAKAALAGRDSPIHPEAVRTGGLA